MEANTVETLCKKNPKLGSPWGLELGIQGRVDLECMCLDRVVPLLPVPSGLVLALTLFFEALVVSQVAGDVLHAALDALPGSRRLFCNAVVVAARLRIIRTIDIIKLAHLCPPMRAATWPCAPLTERATRLPTRRAEVPGVDLAEERE